MSHHQALIFDADGVLFPIHDASGIFLWSKNIEQDLGIPYELLQKMFNSGWSDVIRGTKETRTHIHDFFAQHHIDVSVDTYIEYWLTKGNNVNTDVARHLNATNSYIATNQDPLRARKIEQTFAGRIRKLYASSAIGALKPEADYYAHIERDIGLAPQNITFIDDHFPNVEAARERGWNAHHFTDAAQLAAFLG